VRTQFFDYLGSELNLLRSIKLNLNRGTRNTKSIVKGDDIS